MGRRGTLYVLMGVLMSLLMTVQVQVIAAPDVIDQPASETASDSTQTVERLPSLEPIDAVSSQPDGRPSNLSLQAAAITVFALALAGLLLFFYRGWHRLNTAPAGRVSLPTLTAFALFIGMYLASRAGAMIALQLADISLTDDGSLPDLSLRQIAIVQTGVYAAQGIVACAYVWLPIRWPGRARVADARPSRLKASFIGAIALVIAWPAALATSALVSVVSGAEPDAIAHELLAKMVDEPGGIWLIMVGAQAVIAAPIVEEITYRGILQQGLVAAEVPRWISIAITSAIFATMHMQSVEPQALAALFVLSLGFGYVYERTGRLIAPIVMHMLFNAGNLAMALISNAS
jgi:membrane protease YdiL (CAAX protease family)